MRDPSLLPPVDHLELLADVRPDKFDRAAVRWHGRLDALAALAALRKGESEAVCVLRSHAR
jgi:hypothetical protein